MTDSQQNYRSKAGFSGAQEFVYDLTEVKCSAQLSIAVILSEAPRQIIPRLTEGRGVEGSLRCFGSPCGIKAFSRELPDASFVMQIFPGSFDSPLSRKAGRGLAQADSGKVSRCQLHPFLYNLHIPSIVRLKQLHG